MAKCGPFRGSSMHGDSVCELKRLIHMYILRLYCIKDIYVSRSAFSISAVKTAFSDKKKKKKTFPGFEFQMCFWCIAMLTWIRPASGDKVTLINRRTRCSFTLHSINIILVNFLKPLLAFIDDGKFLNLSYICLSLFP